MVADATRAAIRVLSAGERARSPWGCSVGEGDVDPAIVGHRGLVGPARVELPAARRGELAEGTAEWTDAIERLLTSAERRARLGAAGRRRVEATYSVKAQAGRLVDLLRSAVPRGQS